VGEPTTSAATDQPQGVRHVVARVDDIPDGERLIVDIGKRRIGIFNVRGRFYALLHKCPHASGPLCEGTLQHPVYGEKPGDVRMDRDRVLLSCPWHGWLFDLETGQSWWDPATTTVRRFPVEVAHGDVIAGQLQQGEDGLAGPGPYAAEMYPVEVEEDYVVVTMRGRPGRAATRTEA
jgi:3-phenylpropionate/trans-cinnamate dioxygenase ferredoxin subunit